jgi:hypothetical protein
MAQSIMDYIFRRLALDYLSFEDRSMLGVYSAKERLRHLGTGSSGPIEEAGNPSELLDEGPVVEQRAPSSASRPRPPTPPPSSSSSHRYGVDSARCSTCGSKMSLGRLLLCLRTLRWHQRLQVKRTAEMHRCWQANLRVLAPVDPQHREVPGMARFRPDPGTSLAAE